MLTKRTFLTLRFIVTTSCLAIFLIAAPVCSAPGGEKKSLKASTEESLVDRGDKKEKDGTTKGKKSLKKKAAKKAGTAAVLGVAGKKVVSAVKPDDGK
jgi:hypothetical protein